VKIVVLGAGVQGTVYAVRLALAGHDLTLVARPHRADELRRGGAVIQDLATAKIDTKMLPVAEELLPDFVADICLVTVRREQLEAVLPTLVAATKIPRVVFLMNHAGASDDPVASVGRARAVLAFPGIAGAHIAGDPEGSLVRYLDIPQQRTAVDESAPDIIHLLRQAGFGVDPVRDMNAWLRRHAVFITAIAGSLYENRCDALALAHNSGGMRRFILAVREGWAALDRNKTSPAPFALRTIMCWVPLRLSTKYWSSLLASSRGDIYFARHAGHAAKEMAALAKDVRSFLHESAAPELRRLLVSIDRWSA
jgi:2-dehydropantoate 2-reductase